MKQSSLSKIVTVLFGNPVGEAIKITKIRIITIYQKP